MSSNWNQQSANNQYAGNNGTPEKKGLLSSYKQQQNSLHAPPPASPPPGSYPSHLHTAPPGNGAPPFQQGPQSQHRGLLSGNQGWIAGTMQMVRSWSGKMASVYGYSNDPAPPPLELSRAPSGQLAPEQSKPWKRSLPVRLVMQRRHRRERDLQNLTRGALMAVLLFLVIMGSSGSAYAFSYYAEEMPRLQGLASQHISQTTRIYDRNGKLLYEAYDQGQDVDSGRRTPVSLSDVPKVMQDAMTSAEDPTFWTNAGIDPQGILRNVPGLVGGHASGGGSTITQQVVKNLTHDTTYSVTRKLPEAAMALGLTQQYSKEKILEMYFNVASFGAQELGVEAAAEDYFHLARQCDSNFKCTPAIARLDEDANTHKQDPMLGLARASLLAGMPQNPVNYDPTGGPDNKQLALARQDYVLNQMERYGIVVDGLGPITPDIVQKAEKMTAQWTFTRYKHMSSSHFVDWVINQLALALGNGDYGVGFSAFRTGGFNIRTSLDSNLESYVETAVKRHLYQPDFQMFPLPSHYATLSTDNNVNSAAVVVMNSTTGEILAMNGSGDYNSSDVRVGGEVNVATSARAPGSTFKPIVYATAFQMGWYPGLILPDVKTYFPNGEPSGAVAETGDPNSSLYHPPDYSGTGDPNFHWNRPFPIRDALAMSLNVPAVKAMQFVGVDNMLVTARRMGITSLDNAINQKAKAQRCDPQKPITCLGVSTVLGSNDVPLLQMAGAYQTFADQGTHVPPQGILDIWDNYGNHLYHFDPAKVQQTQVFSKQVAYMMTSVLSDEHARQREFDGDHDLSFWDWDTTCQAPQAPYPDCQFHQVAAKTGTTDNFKDNWAIGYTPNAVVGVWAGNANGESMDNVAGISGAGPIWHSIMEYVSGHCNVDKDGIPCPPAPDRKALNFTQPDTFLFPGGLQKVCTSMLDGLMGNGNCDWVIDGQQPMQQGVGAAPVNPGGNGMDNGGGGNGNNGGGGNGNNGGGDNGNGNGNNDGGGGNGGGNGNGNVNPTPTPIIQIP